MPKVDLDSDRASPTAPAIRAPFDETGRRALVEADRAARPA